VPLAEAELKPEPEQKPEPKPEQRQLCGFHFVWQATTTEGQRDS